MKKTIVTLCTLILFVTSSAFALSLTNIVAYPVPFNPKKSAKYITIDDPGNTPVGNYTIKINVYDINGDAVYSGTAASFPVRWNGRNEKGQLIKPGLYIIKIQVEDKDTGSYNKKMIRIVVQY